MTARSPTAFLLSAMLHGMFAAVLLYTAYSMKDEVIGQAKVLQLVSGDGDNYAATDAPALGTPGGVKFELPKVPEAPAPIPAVAAPPEPAPVQAVTPPPEPVRRAKPEPSPVVKAAPKKTEPAVPDIVHNMKRVEHRMEVKQRAQRAREAKAAAAAAALEAKRAEIAARKAALLKEAGGSIKVSKIDAEGIARGVVGGSAANKIGGANGTALSRADQDLLDTYFALLQQRLREAHEKPPGLSDQLSAQAEFFVAADGSISRASIVQSSGNADFDKSVLAAIRDVHTIGARPDGKGSMIKVRFRMKDDQ